MMQWLQSNTRRACLFATLLAVLAGCDGGEDAAQSPPQPSTFDVAATKPTGKPVAGTVREVPGTASTPQIAGGEATRPPVSSPAGSRVAGSIAPPVPSQIVVPASGVFVPDPPSAVQPAPVSRFTEVAPDTIGGATYQPSPALEYDLGNLVAAASGSPGISTIFITPVKGWLRYPQAAASPLAAATRFPILVFLHGQHSPLDPSYQGYDYLARDLAAHGYVVLSIDANAINGAGGFGDSSSRSRAQLVLGTLDRLRQIDDFGQVDAQGSPGKLDPLRGRLDFTRIGIMGHSRGGQGVANAILFNKSRHGVTKDDLQAALMARGGDFSADFPDLANAVTPATATAPAGTDEARYAAALEKYNIYYADGSDVRTAPQYAFKGAFLLAPTDFDGNLGLNNVPLAVLLPSCDGDVNDLAGAATFDHNRFGPADDQAPRYQILVRGTNHNAYNTIWAPTPDATNDYCEKSGIYLTGEDQRQNGLFLLNSFMRYHVGGEKKFAAYWNGTAQLPPPACPAGTATCDERVVLTVQKGAAGRQLIHKFDGDGITPDADGTIKPDGLKISALGGTIAFSGFDAFARYGMVLGSGYALDKSVPDRLQGFAYDYSQGQGLQSVAEHVELIWSKPPAPGPAAPKRDVSIFTQLNGISARGYDSLTFRVAVVQPIGQEVVVTLADGTGHAASVTASDFSDALYLAPRPKGDGRPLVNDARNTPYIDNRDVKTILNMVAIPLDAFEGVDRTKLTALTLAFPKESGKVAITDIELQDLGRQKPQQTAALH
ncbi:MAG: hypothetical protein ACRECY_11060 [Phyllobacterium sp.]